MREQDRNWLLRSGLATHAVKLPHRTTSWYCTKPPVSLMEVACLWHGLMVQTEFVVGFETRPSRLEW